jgi:hypothetical protein
MHIPHEREKTLSSNGIVLYTYIASPLGFFSMLTKHQNTLTRGKNKKKVKKSTFFSCIMYRKMLTYPQDCHKRNNTNLLSSRCFCLIMSRLPSK